MSEPTKESPADPENGIGSRLTDTSRERGSTSNSPFGAGLESTLRKMCNGKLSAIHWFRTDWQHGGALTGYATYHDDQCEKQVVVKLPVPPIELTWLVRLQGTQEVVPKVFAQGEVLNGYDMAWLVMERLEYGPLGSAWGGAQFNLLAEAAARFYAAAKKFPAEPAARQTDWNQMLDRSRHSLKSLHTQNKQRWNKALRQTRHKISKWIELWNTRDTHHWCHGDLHLGNAMTRQQPPHGPALLIDFALAHPGHWVEDAIYFEHLYWSTPGRGRKLCKLIAHARKEFGLTADPNWSQLAQALRALSAMTTPIRANIEGTSRQLNAALQVLEAELG
ncbi:MAG: hypothetical protein CMJ20_09580 [Phycisphaeraceae bacterium]|nr:hypothetical protein [Phycisphaeraceae bacterium]